MVNGAKSEPEGLFVRPKVATKWGATVVVEFARHHAINLELVARAPAFEGLQLDGQLGNTVIVNVNEMRGLG